jgi:hypothetical protein
MRRDVKTALHAIYWRREVPGQGMGDLREANKPPSHLEYTNKAPKTSGSPYLMTYILTENEFFK